MNWRPDELKVVNLKGNHEAMMCAVCENWAELDLSLRPNPLTAEVPAAGLLIGLRSLDPARAVVVSDFEAIETAGPGNTSYYTVITIRVPNISTVFRNSRIRSPRASTARRRSRAGSQARRPCLVIPQPARLSDRPGF